MAGFQGHLQERPRGGGGGVYQGFRLFGVFGYEVLGFGGFGGVGLSLALRKNRSFASIIGAYGEVGLVI